jgi:poly(hydroxyalkanoate) depolymerase family esterase
MKGQFMNHHRIISSFYLIGLLMAAQAVASTLIEETAFGPNPGNLRLFHYLPDALPEGAPLVVALHGCRQSATDFDDETGWAQWAERWQFALLLPQQQKANNQLSCFNWFQPEDGTRDQGEAASIRAMIAHMITQHGLDPNRIYVTGLSAGGAMTTVLLAAYPDVFAAGAIIAGVPYRCATGLMSAWRCQLWGRNLTPPVWGERVRRATAAINPDPRRWPRVSIWQGRRDFWVNPVNARELMEQWTNVHGIDSLPDGEHVTPVYTRQVYQNAAGQPLVETYFIQDMGHGIPVNPGDDEAQCGIPGEYILAEDICASYHIGRFWGLD